MIVSAGRTCVPMCPHVSPCVPWAAAISPPCSGAAQWRGAGFISSLPKGTEQHFAKKGGISQPNGTGAALNSNMSEIKHRIWREKKEKSQTFHIFPRRFSQPTPRLPKPPYSISALTKLRSSRCGISSEGTGVNNETVSSSGHGNSS